MGSRIELQTILETIMGNRNVYFQPPANINMSYPAIRYGLSRIQHPHANNDKYLEKRSYELTLIDPDPDSTYVNELLKLPYCEFDRQYVSDNLNHYTFTLYF